MPAKTDEKAAPAADVKADELAAVKAELEAAKAELADAKSAPDTDAGADKADELEADDVDHSHTLVLANGETVQTSSPVATHHYGKDGSGPHVVVRAFENAPKEV